MDLDVVLESLLTFTARGGLLVAGDMGDARVSKSDQVIERCLYAKRLIRNHYIDPVRSDRTIDQDEGNVVLNADVYDGVIKVRRCYDDAVDRTSPHHLEGIAFFLRIIVSAGHDHRITIRRRRPEYPGSLAGRRDW